MRQIGSLNSEKQAQRLADFLLTQGIRTQLEPAAGAWAIWVLDEDRVADGRAEFARFSENPEAPVYAESAAAAEKMRSDLIARQKQLRRNVIDVRSQWTRPTANRPVTWMLMGTSIVVSLLTNFGKDAGPTSIMQYLSMASYEPIDERRYFPGPGLMEDLRHGEVWRLVTPVFLHFDPWHLLMNMMATHSLAGLLEMRYGSARLVGLVLFIAVLSNLGQYIWSGPEFGGMSGVVFGLFGFAWMKSRFDPSSGLYLDPASITMMLFFLVLCMTGLVGHIANAAHLIGLLAGTAAGYAPIAWRRLTRGG